MPRLSLLLLIACDREDAPPAADPRGDAPAYEAPAPRLRRLTAAQYDNAITDLFGDTVKLSTKLEPDETTDGLLATATSTQVLSSYGVTQYETAAYDLAAQVLDDATASAAILSCTPSGIDDADCASEVLSAVAWRAWRRPIESDELDVLVDLSLGAAAELESWSDGLEYGLAAILMSPNFLYRIELGEDDPDAPGTRRYSSREMATRLSFFLWNTLPDDELLTAAEAGDLVTDAGLAAQVDRMLADDRARQGVRNFATEWLALYELDDLSKDTTIFTAMSDELGAYAAEETLLGVEALVVDDRKDLRDLFTTQRTFVNRELAAIYNVRAPDLDGFGEVWLGYEGGRRGFFGQVSFLALQAHPTASSPTLRGKFLLENVFCQPIPAPPADVSTQLPEGDDYPTTRDRLEAHMEDPTCASCHQYLDPIGLGFENFDGLGIWRDAENGTTIDASGDVDGVPYTTPWGMAAAVHEDERVGPCLTEILVRYALAAELSDAEDPLVDWHAAGFEEAGYDLMSLMRDVALGPGMRRVGAVE